MRQFKYVKDHQWRKSITAGINTWSAVCCSVNGNIIAAVDQSGYVFISDISGTTWTNQSVAGACNSLFICCSADGNKIFVTNDLTGHLWRSLNRGITWEEITIVVDEGTEEFGWLDFYCSADGTKLIACGSDTYIYTSTTSGATWTQHTAQGKADWESCCLSDNGTIMAVCEYSGHIWISINSGAAWTQYATDQDRNWNAIRCSFDGTKMVAVVGTNGYIYTSITSGATWTPQIGSGAKNWRWVSCDRDCINIILALTSFDYIYISADSGVTVAAQTALGLHNQFGIAVSSEGLMFVANINNDFIWLRESNIIVIGLANNNRYLLETVEGLDVPVQEVQEQKAPYQDGATYIDNLLEPRDIEMTGKINAPNDLPAIYTYRTDLIKALNPKNGPGTLIYTYDNGAVQMGALATGLKFKNKAFTDPFQSFKIDFRCHDPYLYSTTQKQEVYVYNNISLWQATLINEGNTATPLELYLTGHFHTAELAIINNDITEFIKIDCEITSSQYIYINTAFGKKCVLLFDMGSSVSTNIMQYISGNIIDGKTSTFLQLPVGISESSFILTGGDGSNWNTRAVWRDRFVGI